MSGTPPDPDRTGWGAPEPGVPAPVASASGAPAPVASASAAPDSVVSGSAAGGVPGWRAPAPAPERVRPHASGPILGRSVLGPLVGQAARATLVRRRTLLIVLLALLPVGVSVLLGSGAVGTPPTIARAVFTALILPIVVPIMAVVLGTGALGSEIEDGTLVHLLARPVGRGWIMLAKILVAAGGTAVLGMLSMALSGLFLTGIDSLRLVVAMVAGAGLGAIAYASVFVALSAWTSRALIGGLGYVLIWEAVVSGLFPGTRLLSIRVYAEGIAAGLAGPQAGDLGTDVALLPGLGLVAVIVVAALRLGTIRLRAHEMSQST